MTDDKLQSQVEAATVYEAFFVPAIFYEWTAHVADIAGVKAGDRVLDVGCGTGVLARAVAERVGASGSVAGIDPNPGMLFVAEKICPEIAWTNGVAEALPYDDASFDAVVCNFGLMFFTDRSRGLKEMMRVLTPGGRLVVAVWDKLDNIPAYSILVALIQQLVGTRAADALRTPFILGDCNQLADIFAKAGLPGAEIETRVGTARYPSIRSWVMTDVKGWFPLVDVTLEKSESDTLVAEAEKALALFTRPNGTIEFPISVHIVSVTKG